MLPTLPSTTAEGVCWLRAVDEHHPQRIVYDPYARHFLRSPSRGLLRLAENARTGIDLAGALTGGLGGYVQTRHRTIDDALLGHLPDLEQLVVLGAGYDARALRYAEQLGDRAVFEVDHPATLARKRRVLERLAHAALPPRWTALAVDFLRDDLAAKLEAAGQRADRPSFFVWEGVSMYLSRPAVEASLQLMARRAAPGSVLCLDILRYPEGRRASDSLGRAALGSLHLVGEPLTFVIHPADAVSLLARHGWHCIDLADADELARRYVRDGREVYPGCAVLTAVRR